MITTHTKMKITQADINVYLVIKIFINTKTANKLGKI